MPKAAVLTRSRHLLVVHFALLAPLCGMAACREVSAIDGATRDPVDGGTVLFRDPSQPIAARVRDLLSRMTLAEKAAQLSCEHTPLPIHRSCHSSSCSLRSGSNCPVTSTRHPLRLFACAADGGNTVCDEDTAKKYPNGVGGVGARVSIAMPPVHCSAATCKRVTKK